MILVSCNLTNNKPLFISKTIEEVVEEQRDAEWEKMVIAICMAESEMNDTAKNPTSSASGRFQMLTGYVDDVNRICGKKKYTYDDRFNPVKAREMFDIVQGHYNPEKDIDKAITLHRGKRSEKYIKAIKDKMKQL